MKKIWLSLVKNKGLHLPPLGREEGNHKISYKDGNRRIFEKQFATTSTKSSIYVGHGTNICVIHRFNATGLDANDGDMIYVGLGHDADA